MPLPHDFMDSKIYRLIPRKTRQLYEEKSKDDTFTYRLPKQEISQG